jgi:23S rRNA (adenine2503-C2)-methyltransferase
MEEQTQRRFLLDLTFPELQAFVAETGQPLYRARQIWTNLYQGPMRDPAQMTNLPNSLRAFLAERFSTDGLRTGAERLSRDRKTRKWLFYLPDGAPVEAVLMSYERRETVCISTQSGCALGCLFCATGKMGFRRSLSAGEITAQVLHLAGLLRDEGKTLTNIVLMGMGEPFLNYEAVLAALDRLTAAESFGFGARRITLSTVGIVPGIKRFAGEHTQVNLAVSLHAADDELRSRLLPINRKYPLEELFAACDEYIRATNRRLSFEWALIEGVNDSAAQAHRLAARIRKQLKKPLVHVNLIPLNPIRQYRGSPSETARVSAFQAALAKEGIACTVRLPRGVDIAAGCGQLAGETTAPV